MVMKFKQFGRNCKKTYNSLKLLYNKIYNYLNYEEPKHNSSLKNLSKQKRNIKEWSNKNQKNIL